MHYRCVLMTVLHTCPALLCREGTQDGATDAQEGGECALLLPLHTAPCAVCVGRQCVCACLTLAACSGAEREKCRSVLEGFGELN